MNPLLAQVRQKWMEGFPLQAQELGLTHQQQERLRRRLLGRRTFWSFTSDELQTMLVWFKLFRTAREVQTFLDRPLRSFAEAPVLSPTVGWSANARHILTLYEPWQAQDGYAETVIKAGEVALGCLLPEPLRTFYYYWGTRHDLTACCHRLFGPHEIFVQADVAVIGQETAGVFYWGIRRETLNQDDPPVYWAYPEDAQDERGWKLSQDHVSELLDILTYSNALAGAARHGGYISAQVALAVVQQHWQRLELPTRPLYLASIVEVQRWPLYIGPALVLDGYCIEEGIASISVAAGEQAALDHIRDILNVPCQRTW